MKDILYPGLNSKFLKAFIFYESKKVNGKTMSYGKIRKYFDVIQWGAKVVPILLPVSYYTANDIFLSAFQRQVATTKSNGDVDEADTDPIPKDLYSNITVWSVDEGNVYVWGWTTLQWNLIGRCANVELLGFHNFKVFQDSIQIKYDVNKKDCTGKKSL